MKKWLIACFVIYIVGNVITDRLNNRKFTEADGRKLAAELNAKLPLTNGSLRVDEVSYADGVMRYTGTIIDGSVIDDAFKQWATQALRQMYCRTQAFQKIGVGVQYNFRSTGVRSINDRVKLEEWSAAMGPKDC